MEAIVKGLKKNWPWGGHRGMESEEFAGFLCIGYAWLFEKNMLACSQGSDGPFIMQAIGEWNVYRIDFGIVDEFCGVNKD